MSTPLAEQHPPERSGLVSVVAEDFAAVLGRHARAVAVITAGTIRPVGFCATSLAPVSLRPPVLSFAIGRRTLSWRTIERSRHVLVHLLAEDQEAVAATFARRGDKFGALAWHRGPFGLPELDDVLACLALELEHHFQLGDHAIVVGRPVAAVRGRSRRPLLHMDGSYVGLPPIGSTASTVVP